jgi:DNA-binding NarL/FixJ family response regulator
MGKSDLLRIEDVRDAFRLIGDCRDLGREPTLWQVRMAEGLCRLIGAGDASGGEALLVRPDGQLVPLAAFQVGDAHSHKVWEQYMRDQGPAIDPFVQGYGRVPGKMVARTRRQVVADAVYYRSVAYDRYLRVAEAHHRVMSFHPTVRGTAVNVVHLTRPRGDPDFSTREQRFLDFFHRELGPLVGRQLVSAAEPTPEALSPRLRQTLACLAEGDSEKQVAARLGLSPTTVHQYVTTLYRRFGVRSRGQLLAHVLKRSGRANWIRILRAPPSARF